LIEAMDKAAVIKAARPQHRNEASTFRDKLAKHGIRPSGAAGEA